MSIKPAETLVRLDSWLALTTRVASSNYQSVEKHITLAYNKKKNWARFFVLLMLEKNFN